MNLEWRLNKNWLILLVMTAIAAVVFVVLSPKTTMAYSTSQINSLLYGGTATAYSWDNTCKNQLEYYRSIGYAPRAAINSAPTYKGLTWLSARGQGSRVAPVDVEVGTKSVALQLNSIMFLCAGLVSPDGKGADFSRTYANGMITSAGDANDRSPNRVGGGTNQPAMTGYGYRINSISVVGGDGYIPGGLVGAQYFTSRNNSSRYWFSNPINFDYVSNSPDGITSDTNISIKFNITGIATFYGTTHQCTYGGPKPFVPTSTSFGSCYSTNTTMTIQLKLKLKYKLNPDVEINGSTQSTSVESGGIVDITSNVRQDKADTSTNPTDWRVTELRYIPGTVLSSASRSARPNSTQKPCDALPSSGRNYCKDDLYRDADKVFNGLGDSVNFAYQTGEYAIGTLICFVTSVSKPTQEDSPIWSHSAMTCMTIGKKPKVQVWGGDLIIGQGFSGQSNQTSSAITSTTKKAMSSESRIFGSWVEYGIFATGSINGTASKSAFSGDGLIAGALGDQCVFSVLSFTNVDSDSALCTNIGNYSSSQPIPDVGASFTTAKSLGNNASINLATNDLNGLYTATGNLTISGGGPAGAIEKGKWVVINAPNANVTISGNINYTTDQMNSIDQIPQLVIIAKTIGIRDNVTNIDSWLIATDQINTCSSVADNAKLTDKDCDKALVVNGPVMTNKLLLRRTAGSGTGSQSGDPAEVFNLRADAYLWAIARSNDLGRAQTVYSTELPPRF